jgi:hypothetical protein
MERELYSIEQARALLGGIARNTLYDVSVPAWPSAQPAIFRGECASLWRSVRPMPGWIGAA